MIRHRAVTLVEMLVVILIISVLAGLLLTGLNALRRSQRRAATLDLFSHLTTAVGTYLTHWPSLGADADAADFVADPWRFLARDPAATVGPLLELRGKHLARALVPDDERVVAIPGGCRTAPGIAYGPATPSTATHIRDPSAATTPVLEWLVINTPLAGTRRFATTRIELRSAGGRSGPSDDIVATYAIGAAGTRGGTWQIGP